MSLSLRNGGGREGRVAAAPGAPARKGCARRALTTGTGGISGLPCAVVYGLLRALPDQPAFAAVTGAMRSRIIANLTPALARQDHTTSPSAEDAARQSAHSRPPHSAPRAISKKKKWKYFCTSHWTAQISLKRLAN